MSDLQTTISPIDGRVLVERPLATPALLDRALHRASKAFPSWSAMSLDQRAALCTAFLDAVTAMAPTLADELTWQMGRPSRYAAGELKGFADRGHTMIRLGHQALADLVPPLKDGFTRHIRREPLGVVLVLAPWNYPWLTAVNTIIPALMAGNTVLLKHSDQTPLVAERLSEAAAKAGLPDGVFQHIHMSHNLVADAVRDPRVAFVAFTGSVEGGRAVHQALGGTFKAIGLELGGKDPAYVRADADLDFAIENVVDGAFFNSGQSCCAVERVYVHADLYDRFVEGAVALTRQYVLGDPTDAATTLGPVVRARAAAAIQAKVDAAIAQGAVAHLRASEFSGAERGFPYLAPQILTGVTPGMAILREETFGPVMPIVRVTSDEEAIRLMNDSAFGLTASIWTADTNTALHIGSRLETGTVFANRCDYLDPELAWVGVKDSGRGCTLSVVGYESLTRPKSFHLRHR